ncbi:MAG: cooU2 [Bacteroidetes bacterium]|nr:cooU2 [Bacteroidota bacterium]
MSETSGRMKQFAVDCEALVREIPGVTAVEHRNDGCWMTAPGLDVVAMAELMRRMEARLSTITGLAVEHGETAIIYHYCLGASMINIRTTTRNRAIPSITPVTMTADWSEREIGDLYGVSFVGHPNPGRLLRPPSLSPGFFRNPRAEGNDYG